MKIKERRMKAYSELVCYYNLIIKVTLACMSLVSKFGLSQRADKEIASFSGNCQDETTIDKMNIVIMFYCKS